MAETPWYERKAKKLAERDWQEIRDNWLPFVPSLDVPGAIPQEGLGDLPLLLAELSKIDKDNISTVDEINGVRSSVLHEALFHLHKAAHVHCASELHVRNGVRTWSTSSAYQAAMFAARAIMGFLGVTPVETSAGNFLIDVWGAPPKPKRRRTNSYCIVMMSTRRIEQRIVWCFFQRLLDVTVGHESVWDELALVELTSWDITEFARKRNDLHYRSGRWHCDDLLAFSYDAEFGKCDQTSMGKALCTENDDSMIVLSIVMFRMAYLMLEQLADLSAELTEELALVNEMLTGCNATLYAAAYGK